VLRRSEPPSRKPTSLHVNLQREARSRLMLRRLRSVYAAEPAPEAAPESPVEAGSLVSSSSTNTWATVRQASVVFLFLLQLLSTELNVVTHTGLGINAAFASDGPLCTCLQPATYAFSVWAAIYGTLVLYCAFQALPENRDAALVRGTGWLLSLCFVFLAAWGAIASASPVPGNVGVVTALFVLLTLAFRASWLALVRVTKHENVLRYVDIVCVALPISLLTAWLLIAALLNLSILLLVSGVSTLALTSTGSQDLCVSGVTLIALLSALLWGFSRGNPYTAAVSVWGLIGIAVANGNAGRTATARTATLLAILLGTAGAGVLHFFQGPSLKWFGAASDKAETQPLIGKDTEAASPSETAGWRARLRRWLHG
jgi:hypothetical protein